MSHLTLSKQSVPEYDFVMLAQIGEPCFGGSGAIAIFMRDNACVSAQHIEERESDNYCWSGFRWDEAKNLLGLSEKEIEQWAKKYFEYFFDDYRTPYVSLEKVILHQIFDDERFVIEDSNYAGV